MSEFRKARPAWHDDVEAAWFVAQLRAATLDASCEAEALRIREAHAVAMWGRLVVALCCVAWGIALASWLAAAVQFW